MFCKCKVLNDKSIAIIGLECLVLRLQFLLENRFKCIFDISKKLTKLNNNKKFYACGSIDEIFYNESNILLCYHLLAVAEVMKAIPNRKNQKKTDNY